MTEKPGFWQLISVTSGVTLGGRLSVKRKGHSGERERARVLVCRCRSNKEPLQGFKQGKCVSLLF